VAVAERPRQRLRSEEASSLHARVDTTSYAARPNEGPQSRGPSFGSSV
jgi:hypothetical protein